MHPSGHGTMCAFDALIAAPAKTLPECAALLGSGPGSGALARTLSVALQGVLRLVIFWRGRPGRGAAPVVNNSRVVYDPSTDFPLAIRNAIWTTRVTRSTC